MIAADGDMTKNRFTAGALCLAIMVSTPSGVQAGSCLDQVRAHASEYNLSINPPDAPSDTVPGTLDLNDLGKSGGVIEPPPTGDPAVIEPPDNFKHSMPTLPVTPPTPKARGDGDAPRMNAADLVLLESVLVAARSEALRGQEKDCFDRLHAAQKLVQTPSR